MAWAVSMKIAARIIIPGTKSNPKRKSPMSDQSDLEMTLGSILPAESYRSKVCEEIIIPKLILQQILTLKANILTTLASLVSVLGRAPCRMLSMEIVWGRGQ